MKYLFIDTNIYRNLFEKESFSNNFLNLLKNHIEKDKLILLLPDQVKDEICRNRNEKWFLARKLQAENQINNLEKKKEKLKYDFKVYKYISKIEKQIKDEIIKKNKELKEIRKQFLNPISKSNKKLNKVFKMSTNIQEDKFILEKAFYRREKNNPPQDGEKLGDKIIWESLLCYFEKNVPKIRKPVLIFLTCDKKAWDSKTSNVLEFNLWLQKEFKEKTNGSVLCISKIADIPGLTSDEKSKVEKAEKIQDLLPCPDLDIDSNDNVNLTDSISIDNSNEENILTSDNFKK